MVKHEKCHGVNDVDSFLNSKGLSLKDVQIAYGLSKFGGDYFVFYEEEARPKKKKVPATTEDGQELVLTPVERTNTDPEEL